MHSETPQLTVSRVFDVPRAPVHIDLTDVADGALQAATADIEA